MMDLTSHYRFNNIHENCFIKGLHIYDSSNFDQTYTYPDKIRINRLKSQEMRIFSQNQLKICKLNVDKQNTNAQCGI